MTTLAKKLAIAFHTLQPIARGRAVTRGRTASGTVRGEMRRKTVRPQYPPAHSLGHSALNRPQGLTTGGAKDLSEQRKRLLRRRRSQACAAPSSEASARPSFRKATPLMTQRMTPCSTVSFALRWEADAPAASPGLSIAAIGLGATWVNHFPAPCSAQRRRCRARQLATLSVSVRFRTPLRD